MKLSPVAAALTLVIVGLTTSVAHSAAAADKGPPKNAATKSIEIVLPPGKADELAQFAATELQRYLQRLYGVQVTAVTTPSISANAYFFLGTAYPAQLSTAAAQPQLSNQGFLLRSGQYQNKPAMVIVGGSPAATMWGVYEFVERCGVQFLLGGDVFPERPLPLELPPLDRVFEPAFKARWFKTMGDFAMGMEGWGMADYRPFLDQLAKLKFNRIRVGGCPTGPFLDLSLKGARRRSAVLWYGEHFPITPDMPGSRLFGDEKEFWNPDLLTPQASYEQLLAAGQRHMHELIAYAHRRGIEASSVWSIADFPGDLAAAIPGAQPVSQLGQLTVAPGPTVRPDDPALLEVGATLLRSILNEYPDADSYGFAVGTESPSWVDLYEWAWQELDKQYGVESVVPLAKVLERAGKRTDHWDGGASRTVREVKGHITGLYYLLRLWNSPDIVPKSRKPHARLIVYEVAEELWPILPHILPKNAEQSIVMDYNPTRVLRRRQVLATTPAKEVPTTMVLTLHDDSVGTLPLLTTHALHELVGDMRKAGITGFGTRQWLISDHDVSVNYLSKAAWDPQTTPDAVAATQIRAVCGAAAVAPMQAMFRDIETVTTRLEDHGMGITFPHRGMLTSWWSPTALQPPFLEDQALYRRALETARKIPTPARPEGRAYVRYWVGRLQFAVGYFDTLRAVQQSALAEKAAEEAKQKGDLTAYRARLSKAIQHAQEAYKAAFQAIDSYADVARNRADLGAIATMGEFVCRVAQRKTATLRTALEKAQ